jgi:hypothetical protein
MRKLEKVIAGVFIAISTGTAAWIIGSYFCLDKSEWASWVQAIGSILAIVGAVEVGRRQIKAMREEAIESVERADRRRSEAIKAIVAHARTEAVSLKAHATSGYFSITQITVKLPTYTFEETLAALGAIPFHELRSYDVVSALLGLQSSLKEVVGLLSEVSRVGDIIRLQSLGLPKRLRTACDRVKSYADEYREALSRPDVI